MKATDHFKATIRQYLDKRSAEDSLFAVTYQKANKNPDDCVTYILNEVQRSGCNGFADEEIYGMAVHYYDEDDIEVGKPVTCRVAVNHVVELTEEEKQQARMDAMRQVQNETYTRLKQSKSSAHKTSTSSIPNQLTLF
jgi:hypothetical protein